MPSAFTAALRSGGRARRNGSGPDQLRRIGTEQRPSAAKSGGSGGNGLPSGHHLTAARLWDGTSAVLIPGAYRPPTSASGSAASTFRTILVSAPALRPRAGRQCRRRLPVLRLPAPLRSRHAERGRLPGLPGRGWDRIDLARAPLQHRPQHEARSIPIPPILVQMHRNHLKRCGTAPDGRIFFTTRGGLIQDSAYSAVWQEARAAALPPPSKPPRSPGGPTTCGTRACRWH